VFSTRAGFAQEVIAMARIAILLGEGYEDSEFDEPYACLKDAGHELVVTGTEKGSTVHGKKGGSEAKIEHTADELQPRDFDMIVIPGGHGPDNLRLDQAVVGFLQDFSQTGRPVAAICHGPQLLIEADLVKGRTLTSWPSVRKDLENAGADWRDAPVVVDDNLITSRKPDDLHEFCGAILDKIELRPERESSAG